MNAIQLPIPQAPEWNPARNALKLLEDMGAPAMIIGGYLRDLYLKKEPRDMDIVVVVPHMVDFERSIGLRPYPILINDEGSVELGTPFPWFGSSYARLRYHCKYQPLRKGMPPLDVIAVDAIPDPEQLLPLMDFGVNQIIASNASLWLSYFFIQDTLERRIVLRDRRDSDRLQRSIVRASDLSSHLGFNVDWYSLSADMEASTATVG